MLSLGVMQRCIRCPWQLSARPVCLRRTRPSLQWTPLYKDWPFTFPKLWPFNEKTHVFKPEYSVISTSFQIKGKNVIKTVEQERKRIFLDFPTALRSPTIKKKTGNRSPSYSVISNCHLCNRIRRTFLLWENKRIEIIQRQHTILEYMGPKGKGKIFECFTKKILG